LSQFGKTIFIFYLWCFLHVLLGRKVILYPQTGLCVPRRCMTLTAGYWYSVKHKQFNRTLTSQFSTNMIVKDTNNYPQWCFSTNRNTVQTNNAKWFSCLTNTRDALWILTVCCLLSTTSQLSLKERLALMF
jgi:hypothetical protein